MQIGFPSNSSLPKSITILFLVLFFLITVRNLSHGGINEWTPLNGGLNEGDFRSIAIDPSYPQVLYAGTYEGDLFKTINGGAQWSISNQGISGDFIFSIAFESQNYNALYAGSGNGVFKSSNRGDSWTSMNNGIVNDNIRSVVVNQKDPLIIYAGSQPGGVYKTTDGGENWYPFNSGITNNNIMVLAINPVNTETVYAGTYQGGIFRTTDGGNQWVEINNGLSNFDVWSLAIAPSSPETLYAGTTGGLFRSDDSGNSWNEARNDWKDGNIASVASLVVHPEKPKTVYVGTWGEGAYKTHDGGESFISLNHNWSSKMQVGSMAVNPENPNKIYAGTKGQGIWEYTYEPLKWSALIVAAGGPTNIDQKWSNGIWAETKLCTKLAYSALFYQGLAHDDIFFMSHEKEDLIFNGEPKQVVDNTEITKESLQNALQQFGPYGETPAENIAIFLMDHGLDGSFTLGPGEGAGSEEKLYANELRNMLDNLNLPGHVIVLIESCYSGTFIPILASSDHPKRFIVTSASDEKAIVGGETQGRESFSYQFWSEIFGGTNLRDAFLFASYRMPYQTPNLETEIDGITNTKGDKRVAFDITIGYGKFKHANSLPEIIDSEVYEIGPGKILIRANIRNNVTEAWASIMSPIPISSAPDEHLKLPGVLLTDEDDDNWYEGIFKTSNGCGNYKMSIFCSTGTGNETIFSLPREDSINIQNLVLKGDLNDDCQCDLADAILALQILTGLSPNIGLDRSSGVDVGSDGRIGLEEALFALRNAVNL